MYHKNTCTTTPANDENQPTLLEKLHKGDGTVKEICTKHFTQYKCSKQDKVVAINALLVCVQKANIRFDLIKLLKEYQA
jgi:hypothetical protein